MSTEEDTELRDVITQCLESNGCLPKLKAQLRASMFLLLHEDTKMSSLQPLMNNKVKELMAMPEGKLMFYIVNDFLQFCGLDCTLSVFECESYLNQNYSSEDEKKMKEEFNLNREISTPVLLDLIKSFQLKKTSSLHNGDCNNKSAGQLNATFDISNPQMVHKIPNGNISNGEDNTVSFEESASTVDEESINKSSKSEKSKKFDKIKSKSSLLDSSGILPSLYNKELKSTNELEKMFDMETYYEEDFMCSGDDLSLKSYNKSEISSEKESQIATEIESVQNDGTSEINSEQSRDNEDTGGNETEL